MIFLSSLPVPIIVKGKREDCIEAHNNYLLGTMVMNTIYLTTGPWKTWPLWWWVGGGDGLVRGRMWLTRNYLE